MARGIYEIKLKDNLFPEHSKADALDTFNMDGGYAGLKEEDVEINLLVQEDHTLKLFVMAVTMYDTDRFTCKEIECSLCALARELGYFNNADKIADTVIRWVERLDGMSLSEVEEWLIG